MYLSGGCFSSAFLYLVDYMTRYSSFPEETCLDGCGQCVRGSHSSANNHVHPNSSLPTFSSMVSLHS